MDHALIQKLIVDNAIPLLAALAILCWTLQTIVDSILRFIVRLFRGYPPTHCETCGDELEPTTAEEN